MSDADSLLTLGGRLIEERDRETYAELVLWLRSLPPRDEVVKLAQLLGYLTLMGNELPAALTEQLKQIDSVREQIALLPEQILEGMDPEEFAEEMSERFRQQLAATGLQDSAKLLAASTATLQKLSGQIATGVQSLTSQYTSIGETTSRELTKLTEASTQLRQHNADLIAQAREERWLWKALFCCLIFFGGFIVGLSLEKRSTTDAVADIDARVDRLLQKVTPAAPALPNTVVPPKTKKNGR